MSTLPYFFDCAWRRLAGLPVSGQKPQGWSEGPPRILLPVLVRWDLGYIGGPTGYEDAEACNAEDVAKGKIEIDARGAK